MVDGLPEELPSSSSPTTPSFETARAPRVSSAENLDSSSPVDDMRKQLRGARKTHEGAAYLRERRHLDEQALLDRRDQPYDAPTESERIAHEITPLPPAPRRETRRDVASKHLTSHTLGT